MIDLKKLPKVDLHCHLEGAIRPATVLDLYQRNHGRYLESEGDLLAKITATGEETSLFDFLAKFEAIMPSLQTKDDLRRITREAIEDAHRDGVAYLELRFSPHFIAEYCTIPVEEITLAIVEAARLAEKEFGTLVELILIIPQYGGERIAEEAIQLAERMKFTGISGVDIAGDIREIDLDAYERHMALAAETGLGITIHAGEIAPASSIATAVKKLHATRIGHGIRAVEDPAVLRMLLEHDIMLEICLTSNLQTRAARSIETHPLHQLQAEGVWISLNTDDPAISRICLSDEYFLARKHFGMSNSELLELDRKSIRAAFTDEDRKAQLLSKEFNQSTYNVDMRGS